jgi:hypothetical protein
MNWNRAKHKHAVEVSAVPYAESFMPMTKPSSRSTPALAACLLGLLVIHATTGFAGDAPAKSARKSPDWLRKSVVYEIFPRNFSKEGTFNAITARLDELKDLGADVLWLMPIHPIGEKMKKGSIGSPYAVRDYFAINPDYGNAEDFKRLVAGAHARGMKVIMDIVAGHTAWDNVLITQHPEFYKKDSSGKIIPPNPDWLDVAGLNFEIPELRRYLVEMLKHWMKESSVDGFRCDVAMAVPVDFWESARAELEKINPDVVLFADANAAPGLLAKAFDLDNSGAMHGQSRGRARRGAVWHPGGACCAGAHAFARWRAAVLQRHGSGRRHGIRGPRAVREAADLLESGRASAAARDLPESHQAAEGAPGVAE